MNKPIFLTIITTISIAVIGLFILGEMQINSQKVELAALQNVIQKNNNQISTLTKNNANANKQIKSLLSAPTPTPAVVYRTQMVKAQPQDLPQPKVQCKAYVGTKCVVEQLPSGSF